MYGIKFYMGEDIGWMFLNNVNTQKPVPFKTEDEADDYAKCMAFKYNKLIYEIEEIPINEIE